MNAQQDKLHFFALRMRWLAWIYSPIVALWRVVARAAGWFWSLCLLTWRSFVQSFSYSYWFLAVIGGSAAFFFILYFYFLGNRIKEPNLVWIGGILATLPIAWSMAEISSLIRRKLITGEEFSVSEIRFQLGSGFRAVRMLLKYVLWALLLVSIQIGFAFLVYVPSVGPVLFTLAMVPILILSVFAFSCIILILFGLAVFPVHVLYAQPRHGKGFWSRQVSEALSILSHLGRNFFRFIFGTIPVSLLSIPLFLIPGIVFGGAIGVTVFLTTRAMRLGSLFTDIPSRLGTVLAMLRISNWDVRAALSAIFVSVSIAIFAGMFCSLAISFLSSFFFNVYTSGIYFTQKKPEEEEGEQALPSQEQMGLPLPEESMEDEKFKIGDLDTDTGLLGSGDPLQQTAAADVGFDDVSGADILASIESTMPIADEIAPAASFAEEDESLTMDDLAEGGGPEDAASGADILASIESTMPIADEIAPAAAAEKTAAPVATPFSTKGNIGQFGYLVSVKENNRLYFGIKGTFMDSPQLFILNIEYSGGGTSAEQVTIDSLDEKGMGYARLDLSENFADPALGAVTAVRISQ